MRMSSWEEEQEKKIREKKKEIKEQKKKLDKMWMDAKFALKKLKRYFDFYGEDKVLSDEELKELRSPMTELARYIKSQRQIRMSHGAGEIARLIEKIRRNQREVKQVKKDLEGLEG